MRELLLKLFLNDSCFKAAIYEYMGLSFTAHLILVKFQPGCIYSERQNVDGNSSLVWSLTPDDDATTVLQ